MEESTVTLAAGLIAVVQVLTLILREVRADRRAKRAEVQRAELVRSVSARPPPPPRDELTGFLAEQCDRCSHMRNSHVPRAHTRSSGSRWAECAWLDLVTGDPCACRAFVAPDDTPTTEG